MFTSSPRREAKWGFLGFVITNQQINKDKKVVSLHFWNPSYQARARSYWPIITRQQVVNTNSQRLISCQLSHRHAKKDDSRGRASRIDLIRWYTTFGKRINISERIESRESLEGTCSAGPPEATSTQGFFLRNASATERMFAWFFNNFPG